MRNKAKSDEIVRHTFWDLGKDKNIHVEKVNLDPDMKQVIMDPHRINFYAIRWIVKGVGMAYVDNVPYKIKPNLLFVGTPKQISRYDFPKNSHLEVNILAFNHNLITLMNFEKDTYAFLDNLTSHLMFYPDKNEQAFLTGLFKLMIMEFQQENPLHSERILAGLTKSLLFLLFRMKNRVDSISGFNQGYVNLYRQFIHELENHYKTNHNVSEYIERLHVTEKRLNRACKALTHETASTLIHKRIDFEVKRLLFYSSKSVKEIGYETGFRDPAYFSKFFKSMNGETPGAFRKLLHKKT